MNTFAAIKLGRSLPLIILVVVLCAVLFSYYKRSHSLLVSQKPNSRILPQELSALTEGFSVFQSEQGQTTFEIKAKVNLGFRDNKNLLESVTVKVFGKRGERYDTITSKRCEYDQVKEEIVFLDDVVITLGDLSPASKASGGTPPADLVTTIRVDKIRYLQKTATAKTEDEVTFTRGRVRGKSLGLTYDARQGSIELHSQVEILVDPIRPEDDRILLRSGRLKYFMTSNHIELDSIVFVRKSLNELRCNVMRAFLNEQDSSLSRLDAIGDVHSTSLDPRFMAQLEAKEMSFLFGKEGRGLDKVIARGSARARSTEVSVKRDILAKEMRIFLKPGGNLIDKLIATGDVTGAFSDRPATKGAHSVNRLFEPGDRIIKSPEVVVRFKPGGREVSEVEANGPSILEELPLQPTDEKKTLSAMSMKLYFAGDSSVAEKFTANHQVKVDLIPFGGPVKRTTSEQLVALIDQDSRQISQMRQWGNFTYQEGTRLASSDEGHYSVREQVAVLKGQAEVKDASARTTAEVIEFHQLQDLVRARGNVRSVFYNRDPKDMTGVFSSNVPVYASADFMEVQTHSGTAKYWTRAKMWQEHQVLRAEAIYLYREEGKLVADKGVTSLFYLENHGSKEEAADQKPTTIGADRMVYEDRSQRLTYSGNVRMHNSMGILNSARLEMLLDSENRQTSVKRMLATGGVKIVQPSRTSISESAEYFRNEEKVILEGGPPRVSDSERGSTSGARLTMYLNDGSIAVEGDSKTRSVTRQLVAR